MQPLWEPLWDEKQAAAKQALKESLEALERAIRSDIWGYTREHELGRLSVAFDILSSEIKMLEKEET